MSQPSHPKLLVAMPAYNEEKYIGTMVLQARQYADEVIVLDDGSTDNTSRVAQLAGATVIRHEQNKGKGVAIQSILAEVRRRAPDTLVFLDADGQHNPEEIPALIKPISEGFDLVIGSREVQRDRTPFYRRIGHRILFHSTYILSRKKTTDSQCGFRALSGKAISNLQLKENGFAIEAEMIACAAEKGLKVTEVPISNIYTKDGSTLNPVELGFGIFARIVAMISERRPLFFFGLGGGISMALGLLAGARILHVSAAGGGVATGTALVSVFLLTTGIFSIFTGIILNVLIKRKG